MNSSYRNQTASLMGHTQMYDDTYLRRRVKCLTSGLLLCFVIGVAAIGISVIVLLKLNKLQEDPAFSSDLKKEVADLQLEVDILTSQLQDYEHVMMRINDNGNILLDVDPAMEEGEDSSKEEDSSHEEEEEKSITHHHHKNHTTHHTHHHKNHTAHHKNHTDHQKQHTDHQEHHTDHHKNETDHHKHEPHHEDHHTADTPEADHESPEEPISKHIHGTHGTHVQSEGSGDSAEPAGGEPEGGTLCDDSDLCQPSDEIGSIDDILEGEAIEGSGDDCIQFSRPVCPLGASLCYTEDRCPIPICCLEGSPIDDLNYFRF